MKRNHKDKELNQLQSIKKENDKLKRQIASLRKELARVDLDRYKNLKETIEKHYQEDRAQDGLELLEKLKQEWKCREPGCETGYLEIFTYNKIGEVWYYRICSNSPVCRNRTKAQKWSQEVKGIVKKEKQI